MKHDLALARTTSRVLSTANTIGYFNLLLFALAIIGFSLSNSFWFLLDGFLMLWMIYLYIRVRLDFLLLHDFADETLSPVDLDQSLSELKLRKNPSYPSQRSMKDRCTASIRLYRQLLVSSGIHLIFISIIFLTQQHYF